jgi:FKBP-type peptidyl-prolyl cis-trans isomerase
MTRLRAFSILLALGLVACGDSTDPLTNDDFAPELGVDLDAMTQTASGLYYQDLEVGEGAEAVTGSAATVHYEGFLANGNKFDSSRDRDEPFTFAVGIGGVIPGFDEGVSGMRVGGVRKLVIPPELAYGESGAGTVIPPNATLVFDIELLEVAQ